MQFITGPKLNGAAASTGALSPEVIAVYPMTKAQESLWLAYSMAPNHTLYNLSLKFVFNQTEAASDGSIAIRDLTRRHAILRSTFHGANQSQARPFVAEHNPDTATASFRIVPKPRDARGEAKVLGLLRTAVNLSQEFASRWLAVVSDREIELYLVAHHIALDGTSMSSISAELFKLLSGSPATPAEQPFCQAHMYEVITYIVRRFSSRRILTPFKAAFSASPEYQAAERFWLDQVMHVRPYKWITNPSSRPAPSKSYREIQTWFDFSKDDLAAWGSKYRTSWFRVAVAMVGLLTRAHTEPDYGADQTVTVAFGGRPAGLEKSIGHFANAMPIRIPFTEASRKTSGAAQVSFDNLVKLVSKQISTAKKHERYSILDLSRARASRGLETPRAQVAVTLSPKLSHKECTLYPVEGPYDLFFCFLEGDDNVTLGVIYDPIIFSTADVARLKDEFSSLRERSMTDPSFGVSGISGVQSHLPRLLPELDLSNVDEISAARFHAWFEQQALAHPNLVALHSAERNLSVTYKELNERSNRLGHYLREIGISRGSLVLLYLEHGPAVMEWIIAVLKAGAAYAVADQSNPPERIRSIVSVAEPVLVIHDQKGEAIREIIQESPVKTLDIRTVQIEKFSSESLEEVTQNTDLAYIVFTSGSTGQPKGVEIEHRNLSHFVANAFTSNYTTIGPGTRVLQLATFAFDAAVLEWSQCLSLGGTLCFADVPKALVGDYLADVIDLNEVSFMHLTPSVLATLPTSRPLPSLRQISVGGEMVPDNLIKKWRSRVQVVNAYGPTECTVVMAHQPQPIASDAPQPAANIIGAAHQHMKFYVSNDAFTRLLPAGEVGEVCIGGPQVGRGYKSRPDLTENRFAVHPELGARLYRTGDRGKLLGDGSVFLVGRIDREVKVRGDIELDDVERTITDVMPEVTAVSVQPDSSSTSLWAFVSPDDIDGDVLRNRLTERLPAYMVPSTVYALPQLPLNMNGKVDHKSIAANMESLIVEATTSGSSSSATPSLVSSGSTTCRSPSTSSCSDSRSASPAITSAVTRIWQDILGTKGLITTSDNFFDLGGNSLSANKLATQLRSEFSSSNITVLDIFSSPTIQGQVDLLCGSELDSYVQSKLDSLGRGRTKSPAKIVDSQGRSSPSTIPSGGRKSEIAIVGISGRFPGASNPDELYRLFRDRKEGISELEGSSGVLPFPGAIYVPRRGAIKDVEYFDPAAWGLKEDEARNMDPQQRLFMESTLRALQDANRVPSIQGTNNIGLFVGAARDTWQDATETVYGDEFYRTHRADLTPSISARTAYHLNLQGPNVTLNTACSSGMVALSVAVDQLRAGRCDMAVAGAVAIAFPQEGYVTAESQIFSPSGHCRPFDHRADGTLPADGVCALVLRPLDDAVRDGDKIYSVISGIATGSDGRLDKAGVTAPSPRGQADTIERAWKDAGIPMSKAVYAELHGSGTPIGDALELEGFQMARSRLGAANNRCTVGSNKGNLGNCEAASGLVSVIKMCKSMQYGVIPPVQSLERVNPLINPSLPFDIAQTDLPLSDDAVVCVSSTGLGGVNAHCVLRS
ncbi:polyketide synthetase, partial [Gloeophyllum trabeum ATCC 11539]|uniref:Hybrid PKS-NRPS synthetase TAS1 n=1 Tax=Gloeophyllum trabeum (strain ATCC 11539 / FP-39264 / Madison 617) TaxID=670483 RepID=TAS1_GLOTA